MAIAATTALAATPVFAIAAHAAGTAKTKPPKAGQKCTPKKKAPTGFKCHKNSKGKYVLVKSKKG